MPVGILIAGSPAKLTGTVKTSFRYISTGLLLSFDPNGKAAVGVVGVKIALMPDEKTFSKIKI